MKYETPEIPEGINTTQVHPLKTFSILLTGLLVVLLLSAWLLGLGGGYLARKIPYEQEKRLADTYQQGSGVESELQVYLQTLADRVSRAMKLDKAMSITIHYVDEPVENAFATIGGHVFLYKGLLEKLPSENALAMLIAHEIAHVMHRDPMVSVGQSAAISTGMMLLLGHSDKGILGSAGLLTQMNFSRDMEADADQKGLKAVNELYGHVSGALGLYEALESIDRAMPISQPEFFSTHPESGTRLKDLSVLIASNGWAQSETLTPLPDLFSLWLSDR